MDIQTVGVVGAGVMGSGVSQNLAQTGHQVILLDVSPEILEHAKNEIKHNVRFQTLFTKNKSTESLEAILVRTTFSTDYELLSNLDYVIENVTEKWAIKKEIYAKLDKICLKQCIFVANTSAIPITRLASVTERASQVIGIHFMNPAPLKPIVEMIRGFHTCDETLEITKRFLTQMG